MQRKPVAILGATGMVGQRMLQLLAGHPWFELVYIAASSRSAGKPFKEASVWRLPGDPPAELAGMVVGECSPSSLPEGVRLVFSALDSKAAGPIEARFAEAGCYVISNAGNHRMDPSIPLVIPEVNPGHLELLEGRPGIVTNPNCCAIPLALSLAPLHERWGVEAVCVSTYQAVSGAGYPGESAWDMVANVHPHSVKEETKLSQEPRKILGSSRKPASLPISARCVRVPTADGHLLAVQARLSSSPPLEEVRQCMAEWRGNAPQLPSSPTPLLRFVEGRDRPSPRFDSMAGGGMALSIGRLESCEVMGIKYFVLGHNTIRGAAGAALANAELLCHSGLV
jgi:aspartate-semialdehyde dehydrogenase